VGFEDENKESIVQTKRQAETQHLESADEEPVILGKEDLRVISKAV